MIITIVYENGNVTQFEPVPTASHFGTEAMLVEYYLERAKLYKSGLWLYVHHYDAKPIKIDEDDDIQEAVRKKGKKFLLADVTEIERIHLVLVDGREVLIRIEEGLVPASTMELLEGC